ncbi:MAG: SDR family oxidoreductase [Chloroflexi bacterium]|nr:SDR family oxidoreductase [Chloroflexota bacterium]MCL5274135.1 SDR family oxidoreductase [Chloroflexota bacterium]
MDWSGHVAIVTGAGSGIGLGIAECFAEAGAEVVLAELNQARGRAAAGDLQRRFGKGDFIQTDVSKGSDCKAIVDYALKTYGRVDTLVNNAGVNFVKPTLEMDEADWDRVINVDLKGTFMCSRYALEAMASRRSGNIINIASVHTVATLPEAAPYAAAKGGVAALTRSLAIEFAQYGIRVNAVSPGLTDTQIWQDIQNAAESAEDARRHWFDNIPMQRVQSSREVGNVVLFLASDQSSYITGANIMTDGGMTAQLVSRARYASKPLEGKAGE